MRVLLGFSLVLLFSLITIPAYADVVIIEVESNPEGDDEGAARREYDLRKGILDPKTGERKFPKADPNAPKKFVTKEGKALPVGTKAK